MMREGNDYGAAKSGPLCAKQDKFLSGTSAARLSRSFDPNWLAVLLFMIVLPMAQAVAYRLDIWQLLSPPVALGVLAVSYPVFYISTRHLLSAAQGRALGILLAGSTVLLLVATDFCGVFAAENQPSDLIAHLSIGVAIAAAFLLLEIGKQRLQRLAFLPTSLLAALAAVAGAGAVMEPFLTMTVRTLPIVGDEVFRHLDSILGLDVLTIIAQFEHSSATLHFGLEVAYSGLIFLVAGASWSEQVFRPEKRGSLLLQILVAACIGYACYFVMPAVGPRYFFGSDFPMHMPETIADAVWTSTATDAPRNCLPSLHATWSILTWLSLRHSPRWHRQIGAVFVFLTFLATLGLGEHYAIDWLAAMPLVALVRGITCNSLPLSDRTRQQAICAGAALLVGWVIVLRLASGDLDSGIGFAIFSLTSLLLPMWLEARLAQVERKALQTAASVTAEPLSGLSGETEAEQALQALNPAAE